VIVCVDFQIAGPQEGVPTAWKLIRGPNPRAGGRGIILDDPAKAGKFLGCNHECSHVWAPPMNGDRKFVHPLDSETATEGVQDSDTKSGVQYSAGATGSVGTRRVNLPAGSRTQSQVTYVTSRLDTTCPTSLDRAFDCARSSHTPKTSTQTRSRTVYR
jgi:hypothetical protein